MPKNVGSIENVTFLEDLIDPQVLADMVNEKITDYMKFAPLCTIDHTLQGRAGSTVTLPKWGYIGDAEVVPEGGAIPISALSTQTTEVTIQKVGKGVSLTDEALLSAYADPMDRAAYEISISIASKVDNDVLATCGEIGVNKTHTFTGETASVDDVIKSLTLFGEDMAGSKALLCSPKTYEAIRLAGNWCPASEISAGIYIRGALGMVAGCQIIVSNKLAKANTSYIIKPNALRIFLKRDMAVEVDRDIIHKTTYITADKHYVTYLYDESKAIKLMKAA